MNDEFETLWQAQTIAPHDANRLVKTLKKQRIKYWLSNCVNILAIPPAIWLAYTVVFGGKHWAVKAWVVFCMVAGVIVSLVSLYMSRLSMSHIRQDSNQAYVERLTAQTKTNITFGRIHLANGIWLGVGFTLFLCAYIATSAMDPDKWMRLGVAVLAMLVVCVGSRWYGQRCVAKYQKELDWLNSLR